MLFKLTKYLILMRQGMLTKYIRSKTNTIRMIEKLAKENWVIILCRTQNDITHIEMEREKEENAL